MTPLALVRLSARLVRILISVSPCPTPSHLVAGPIPTELGELENLVKLYLWGNNLSGKS